MQKTKGFRVKTKGFAEKLKVLEEKLKVFGKKLKVFGKKLRVVRKINGTPVKEIPFAWALLNVYLMMFMASTIDWAKMQDRFCAPIVRHLLQLYLRYLFRLNALDRVFFGQL